MGRWMFSVCIMVVEAWGNVYFFDTFLGRKKGIFFCRYRFPAYLAMMFAASTAGYWIDMWKLPVYILGTVANVKSKCEKNIKNFKRPPK